MELKLFIHFTLQLIHNKGVSILIERYTYVKKKNYEKYILYFEVMSHQKIIYPPKGQKHYIPDTFS